MIYIMGIESPTKKLAFKGNRLIKNTLVLPIKKKPLGLTIQVNDQDHAKEEIRANNNIITRRINNIDKSGPITNVLADMMQDIDNIDDIRSQIGYQLSVCHTRQIVEGCTPTSCVFNIKNNDERIVKIYTVNDYADKYCKYKIANEIMIQKYAAWAVDNIPDLSIIVPHIHAIGRTVMEDLSIKYYIVMDKMTGIPYTDEHVHTLKKMLQHFQNNTLIIHGDIKPANVWIDNDKIVMFDFGESTIIDPNYQDPNYQIGVVVPNATTHNSVEAGLNAISGNQLDLGGSRRRSKYTKKTSSKRICKSKRKRKGKCKSKGRSRYRSKSTRKK
jgi:serine/threonine protein kinase